MDESEHLEQLENLELQIPEQSELRKPEQSEQLKQIQPDLPEDVLRNIFLKLDCDFDQLMILRQVNDKFRFIIDQLIKLKPLRLDPINTNTMFIRISSKLYKREDLFISNSILQFRLSTEIHSQIQKLSIYNPYIVNHLKLPNLTHLHIVNNECIYFQNQIDDEFDEDSEFHEHGSELIILEFKQLKYLSLQFESDLQFFVESDKLTTLELKDNIYQVCVSKPERVQYLSVDKLSNRIFKFKNIEALNVQNFSYLDFPINLLDKLPRLKHLFTRNAIKRSMNKIRDHKKEKNSEVKIYYNNINIKAKEFKFELVDQLKGPVLNEITFGTCLNMYRQFGGFPSIASLRIEDFSPIINNLPISSMVFKNYLSEIRTLTLYTSLSNVNLKDWTSVLGFLNLTDIVFECKTDSQYLNVLPKYCKYLQRIELKECEDLSFILQLKFLNKITFLSLPDLEFVGSLMKNLDDIRSIHVKDNHGLFNCFYNIEFNIMNGFVSCKKDGELLFQESKFTFLNSTIYLSTWSTLFKIDHLIVPKIEMI